MRAASSIVLNDEDNKGLILGFQTALSSWQDNFSFKQLYVVFKFMLDTGNFKIDLSAASWYNT